MNLNRMLRGTAMATGALALAGLVGLTALNQGAQAQEDGNITLFTFENLVNPPLTAEYKAKYGVEPNTVVFADEDEAFAKMRANFTPDLMGPCSYEFERWKEAGLLQPIDVTKLKYWDSIPPSLKTIPGMMASETTAWFVPQYWASTSITYRRDLAPEYAENQSFDILWDPKYQGRVAGLEGVDDTVTLTAKAMGFDPYNLTPEQWAQVQEKLRALVANARFITSDQTSIAQGLASGEIVAAITWSDSWAALKNDGVDVGFMNPPAGMFTYVCGFVVHKDATELDRIYTLIDSGLSQAAAEYLVSEYSNGSANAAAMAALPADMVANAGLPADVDAFLASGTFQIRLPNKDEIIKAWTEIRAGL
ncbi:MAG TPA: extracellular solute-binding protein [Micropepsaceae bacterium]|nr:extracellular solute-binding protein [Micropepsaceae bacterium]